jgi:hypothetical protein
MRNRFRASRLIGLLAAYVIALQALLLPLSVAAGAFAGEALCLASADGTHQPADQDSPHPCAAGCGMHCNAQAFAAPPLSKFAPVSTETGAPTPLAAIEAPFQRTGRDAHAARAPPAV